MSIEEPFKQYKNEMEFNEETDATIYDGEIQTLGIQMEMKDVTSVGGTLRFVYKANETVGAGSITTGERYYIQKRSGGGYEDLLTNKEEDSAWIDVGWPVGGEKRDSVFESQIDWSALYGKLESGEYRIIKPITTNRYIGSFKRFYIADDFIVTD